MKHARTSRLFINPRCRSKHTIVSPNHDRRVFSNKACKSSHSVCGLLLSPSPSRIQILCYRHNAMASKTLATLFFVLAPDETVSLCFKVSFPLDDYMG
jgi:hypothetical protein